ncbi:hypothetical protein EB231_11180 [Mesorhizobium sp. NZP2298]|nr:hypothetical protein EB231_11180 [Mesorhizobium sp. NZP2298]
MFQVKADPLKGIFRRWWDSVFRAQLTALSRAIIENVSSSFLRLFIGLIYKGGVNGGHASRYVWA